MYKLWKLPLNRLDLTRKRGTLDSIAVKTRGFLIPELVSEEEGRGTRYYIANIRWMMEIWKDDPVNISKIFIYYVFN